MSVPAPAVYSALKSDSVCSVMTYPKSCLKRPSASVSSDSSSLGSSMSLAESTLTTMSESAEPKPRQKSVTFSPDEDEVREFERPKDPFHKQAKHHAIRFFRACSEAFRIESAPYEPEYPVAGTRRHARLARESPRFMDDDDDDDEYLES